MKCNSHILMITRFIVNRWQWDKHLMLSPTILKNCPALLKFPSKAVLLSESSSVASFQEGSG